MHLNPFWILCEQRNFSFDKFDGIERIFSIKNIPNYSYQSSDTKKTQEEQQIFFVDLIFYLWIIIKTIKKIIKNEKN